VATLLVQNGTIRIGDQLTFENIIYGKVRSLKNYLGENIDMAVPSQPALLIGLKILPQVGDILQVGEGEKMKIKKIASATATAQSSEADDGQEATAKKICVIIKSDVLGSAEAIEESLEKLNTKDVKVKILHKGMGNVSDGDIKRAEAANAIILGFNVKVPSVIEEMAREKKIEIKTYQVIYHLINDIREKMQALVGPVIKRVEIGKLKVLAVFHTDKNSQIIGGKIVEGKAENEAKIEIMRGQNFIGDGKLSRLQAGKQNVQSADTGQECGILFEGKPLIQKDDILQFFKEEKIETKL
jgi:translation initiation factor IF-2